MYVCVYIDLYWTVLCAVNDAAAVSARGIAPCGVHAVGQDGVGYVQLLESGVYCVLDALDNGRRSLCCVEGKGRRSRSDERGTELLRHGRMHGMSISFSV